MPFIPDTTQPAATTPVTPTPSTDTSQIQAPATTAAPSSAQLSDPNQSGVGQFVNQQAQQWSGAAQQEGQMGLNPIARGQNFVTDALTGLGNIFSGVGKMVYAPLSVVNPGDTRTMEEKSAGGIEGLNQLVGGAFQTVSSPLSVSPLLKQAASTPFEAGGAVTSGVVKALGVDPNSQKGQDIVNSVMSAAGVALAGNEIGKGWDAADARTAAAANDLTKNTYATIQNAMPESLSNKLIDVTPMEKVLTTQSLMKTMTEKVDLPQWTETFDTQLEKLNGLIKDNQQYGQISLGDMHSILSDMQQVSPEDLSNPYLGEVNGMITKYLVDEADKQTSGILGKFYNDIGQKIGQAAIPGATPAGATPPTGTVPPTGEAPQPGATPPGTETPMTEPQAPQGRTLPKTAVDLLAKAGKLEPGDINFATEHPAEFRGVQAQGVDPARADVLDQVKQGIDNQRAATSEAGHAYDDIRQQGGTVKMADESGKTIFQKYAEEQGLQLKPGKTGSKWVATTTSKVQEGADLTAINNRWKMFGQQSEMTPEEFLNFRHQVGQKAAFGDGTTSSLKSFNKGLYSALNDEGRPQIPGLAEKDATFETNKASLDKVEGYLYKDNGELKDTAMGTVNNLLRQGNESKLAKIEEAAPGITAKLKAIKAVQGFDKAAGTKPGSYLAAAIPVMAAVKGGLPGVAFAVGEQFVLRPDVISEALLKYGEMDTSGVEAIMSKVKKGIQLNTAQLGAVAKAVAGAGLLTKPQDTTATGTDQTKTGQSE